MILESRFVQPADGVVIIKAAKQRSASRHKESAIHAAADTHLQIMTLALRAAFNVARKALKGSLRAAGDVEGHEFHGNQYTTSYHGTKAENVDKVLKEGIKPTLFESATPYAWTASTRKAAEFYAGKNGVVLKVRAPKSAHESFETKAGKTGAYVAHRFKDTIKPEWISIEKPRHAAASLDVGSLRAAGDVEGHEFHGNQYTAGGTFYHGTSSKNAEGIAKTGLKPGSFVTNSKFYAKFYGSQDLRGDKFVMLKVQVPKGHELTPQYDKRFFQSKEAIHKKHVSVLKDLELRTAISAADISACLSTLHAALLKVLPPVLAKVFVAGANAGVGMLPKRRAAGSADQPRDEHGRWSGGGVLYHGTSSTAAEKIKTEGLKSGVGKGVGMFGGQTNAEHVNLTTDKTLAKVAASLAADANPGSHGVVIEVRIPKSDKDKVKVNPNNSTTYLHKGTIHPDHLTFKAPRDLAMRTLDDTFSIRFDVSDPRAVKWAEEHAGELAKDLSDTSKQRIKDVVARAMEGDGLDAAYDDILEAVGDEARAEMIARTEIMSAANQGTLEAYSQAQEAGLLPSDAQKEWIATSDACDVCAELDGVTVGLDESFDFDGEDIDSPPGHPHCRCTIGIAAGGSE